MASDGYASLMIEDSTASDINVITSQPTTSESTSGPKPSDRIRSNTKLKASIIGLCCLCGLLLIGFVVMASVRPRFGSHCPTGCSNPNSAMAKQAHEVTHMIQSCAESHTSGTEWFKCEFAYEGYDLPGVGHEWTLNQNNPGRGGWMKVTLNGPYLVTYVGILPRCMDKEQTKSWDITVGDVVQRLEKPCGGSGNYLNCTGPASGWYNISLSEPAYTHSVKFTIVDVCGTEWFGFREIKLYGYKVQCDEWSITY